MNDQASYLRKLVKKNNDLIDNKFGFSRVIAVTSGKGGVGKTSFTTNLAIELAALGKRVVVFDADLGLANMDITLGVNATYNLSHVIRGVKRLDEIMVDTPYGFKLIPASSGVAELTNLSEYEMSRVIADFERIDKNTDVLLIDTAAGIARNVLNFVLASKEILMITTPEPTAITDAYALVKTLAAKTKELDIKLILNQGANELQAKRIVDKIKAVCRQFLKVDIQYLGFIPRDPVVPKSIILRKPLVRQFPNSKAALKIKQLSKQIATQVVPKEMKSASFFEKLAKAFS